VSYPALVMGVVCFSYWMIPGKDPLGRASSLCFALLTLYFTQITIFPWYLPPAALFAWVTLTCALTRLTRELGQRISKRYAWGPAGTALALVAGYSAYLAVATTRQMRIQMSEVEWGNRRVIGLWLKENVRPGERVFSESLGYLGYFSGAKMLDALGLVAPEVVAVREAHGAAYVNYVRELKPEWVVVRPLEKEAMVEELGRNYREVKEFDVSPQIQAHGEFPGEGYVYFDSVFTVYRRVSL
jgi:hypothetical protein